MIPTQMLKGILEGCILKIISLKATYAYQISNELMKYGFGKVSEGTIYPIILRFQKNGWVDSLLKTSDSGPQRKYYSLTARGKQELDDFQTNWQMLNDAISNLLKEKNDVT